MLWGSPLSCQYRGGGLQEVCFGRVHLEIQVGAEGLESA